MPRPLSSPCLVLALALVVGSSTSTKAASTGTFFSTPALLKQTFATSARVGFVKVTPPATKTTTTTTTRTTTTNVFVATTGERVDGYAVVLDEQGQHEPITFFVAADAAGTVLRVEVMAYSESYGHEIRSPRYLQQYVGRHLPDGNLPARVDVAAISGATISSNSAGRAVARALALIRLAHAQSSSTTSSTSSSSPSSSSPRP